MRRTLAFAVLVAGALARSAPCARADGVDRSDGKGVAFEQAGLPLPDALRKASLNDRLVLVALSSKSCTWCRALERDTFSSSTVADALKSAVCVRYEAEAEPGAELARRFAVDGYPTVLFLDRDGREVDRIVGYLTPERFAKEVARIRAGDGTLRALRDAHEKDPKSAPAAVAYARRLARGGDTAGANAILLPLASGDPADAGARLALAEGLAKRDPAAALAWATRLTDEQPDATEAGRAWLVRVDAHLRRGEVDEALADATAARDRVKRDEDVVALEQASFALARRRSETALLRWGERALSSKDAEALGAAARAAFTSRLLVGSAVHWAEKAVEWTERDPEVLVTWAELLAETNSPEKALAVAKEAEPRVRDEDVRTRLAVLFAKLSASPSTVPEKPPKSEKPAEPADADAPAPPAPGAGDAPKPDAPKPDAPKPAPAPAKPTPSSPCPDAPLPPRSRSSGTPCPSSPHNA